MVINEGPVRNLINKAKKSYNAVMGNTSGNYDMSVHSHDEAKELLSGTVLKGYEDEFDEDSYQMSYDPDRSYLKFEFSAKRVPNSLVNDLKPGSGKLYKYVTNYDKDHAVLTMELPVDRQVMKAVYNDNAPKSNAKPTPKDTMNPKDGTTQDDQESAEMTGESMMAPTNLTITGKRTLQCDDEGHEILRDKVLGEGMVIREAYYKEIRSKTVYDSDGFTTEYTLYHNTDDDTYLCIFGDRELYTPEDTDPDMEFESEDEALEWFNDYEGPGSVDIDQEDEDTDVDYYTDDFESDEITDEDEEENLTLSDLEEEESDELSEDYWFGGDGKLDDQNNPTNPFETKETETETQDKIDQDKLDLLDKVVDDMDDELSDGELKEDLLDETPGLKLSVPRITYKDQDDLEGRLEIEINGKVYKYRVNPEVDLTTDELASKVTGIQKYSDGKALAYLKRNAHTVTESYSDGYFIEVPDGPLEWIEIPDRDHYVWRSSLEVETAYDSIRTSTSSLTKTDKRPLFTIKSDAQGNSDIFVPARYGWKNIQIGSAESPEEAFKFAEDYLNKIRGRAHSTVAEGLQLKDEIVNKE